MGGMRRVEVFAVCRGFFWCGGMRMDEDGWEGRKEGRKVMIWYICKREGDVVGIGIGIGMIFSLLWHVGLRREW